MGYDAIVKIEAWLPICGASFVFGEGDRLANGRFFELAREAGQLTLFHLNPSADVIAARREARAKHLGTKAQNESWARGRATKHENLAAQYGAILIPNELSAQQGADFMNKKLTEKT